MPKAEPEGRSRYAVLKAVTHSLYIEKLTKTISSPTKAIAPKSAGHPAPALPFLCHNIKNQKQPSQKALAAWMFAKNSKQEKQINL